MRRRSRLYILIPRRSGKLSADINIEDSGSVTITAVDSTSIEAAEIFVKSIVDEIEVGKIYHGTVVRIMDFGAFVEIAPGKDGLVHISKLDNTRVNKVTDVVNVGDKIKVKVVKIDNNGRIDLSKKDVKE